MTLERVAYLSNEINRRLYYVRNWTAEDIAQNKADVAEREAIFRTVLGNKYLTEPSESDTRPAPAPDWVPPPEPQLGPARAPFNIHDFPVGVRPLVAYLEGMFESNNVIPVTRPWFTDESWSVVKDYMRHRLPLDFDRIEIERIYRRMTAMGRKAYSPLEAALAAAMTPERWRELEMGGDDVKLTPEEIAQGWHFCDSWDGMHARGADAWLQREDHQGEARLRRTPSEERRDHMRETAQAGEWPCSTCGKPTTFHGTCVTLVGYFSPFRHDHDDNCLTASYQCEDGHWTRIDHQRKCPTEGCDWTGKLTCFCHKGEKVGIWVNDRPETRCPHRWKVEQKTSPAGIEYRTKTCIDCGAVPSQVKSPGS